MYEVHTLFFILKHKDRFGKESFDTDTFQHVCILRVRINSFGGPPNNSKKSNKLNKNKKQAILEQNHHSLITSIHNQDEKLKFQQKIFLKRFDIYLTK